MVILLTNFFFAMLIQRTGHFQACPLFPLFQKESWCTTLEIEMSFTYTTIVLQIKIILI